MSSSESEPESWESLLDDLDWLDEDDDLDDPDPLLALRESSGFTSLRDATPAADGEPAPTAAAMLRGMFDEMFSDDELVEMFPTIEVAINAAEDVDDRVPDPAHADLGDLRWAIWRYERAIAECAELKALAESALYARVARRLKTSIRSEKATIIGWRDRLAGTLRTREREASAAAKAGPQPKPGFGSWGSTSTSAADQARRNAEHQAKIRRINKETLAIYAETGRQNRIAAEKRFQTMNAALFGRRYY